MTFKWISFKLLFNIVYQSLIGWINYYIKQHTVPLIIRESYRSSTFKHWSISFMMIHRWRETLCTLPLHSLVFKPVCSGWGKKVARLFSACLMVHVCLMFAVTNTINKTERVSHQRCDAIKPLCVWSCDGPFLISNVMSSPAVIMGLWYHINTWKKHINLID